MRTIQGGAQTAMHIPDGFLSTPVWVTACAVSAGAVGYSVRKLKGATEPDGKEVPLMGMVAAFVFAAQMVNFPIASGTSGHLVGAVLAAIILGPYAATLIMAAILIVQALLFQDGGITALGTNILNMGVLGSMAGYLFYRLLKRLLPGNRGAVTAAFLSSLVIVVSSAALASVEIALSGTAPLKLVLTAMVGVHVPIGIGEGLITAAAVAFLLRVRRDMIFAKCRPVVRRGPGLQGEPG